MSIASFGFFGDSEAGARPAPSTRGLAEDGGATCASRWAGRSPSSPAKSELPALEAQLVWRLPPKPVWPTTVLAALEGPRTNPLRRAALLSIFALLGAASAPMSETLLWGATAGAAPSAAEMTRDKMQRPGPSNLLGLYISSSPGPQMRSPPALVMSKMYGIAGGLLPSSQTTCKSKRYGHCEQSRRYSPTNVFPRSMMCKCLPSSRKRNVCS
mmetsp:Transcript_91646/g.179536  ORF Transcript_91646/g.179536 Transcript_91646/m.179536 type:complete len:213 (+) Transcript_91646:241-879(+)